MPLERIGRNKATFSHPIYYLPAGSQISDLCATIISKCVPMSIPTWHCEDLSHKSYMQHILTTEWNHASTFLTESSKYQSKGSSMLTTAHRSPTSCLNPQLVLSKFGSGEKSLSISSCMLTISSIRIWNFGQCQQLHQLHSVFKTSKVVSQ